MERELKYNYRYGKKEGKQEEEKISSSPSKDRKKTITSATDLFDSDEEIAQKYDDDIISKGSISHLGDELTVDAIEIQKGLQEQ